MIVAVFGSASPKYGDEIYMLAMELGKALGERSLTVMTGGYCGIMEATLRGALETGAHTIGVTCDEITAYRPGTANEYVIENVHTKTLNERIDYMVRHADAFIALPGGIGTSAEVMMAYNLMVIGAIDRKPFVLMGESMASLGKLFFAEMEAHIPNFARELLAFVNTVDEAVEILEKSLKE